MRDITPKQDEVLSFYKYYRSELPYSPTIREVAFHFHIAPTTAFEHVQNLVKRGDLVRMGDGMRNYRPKRKRKE